MVPSATAAAQNRLHQTAIHAIMEQKTNQKGMLYLRKRIGSALLASVFSVTSAGAMPIVGKAEDAAVLGDVNQNNVVEVEDAVSVLTEYAAISAGNAAAFSAAQKAAGDVDCDNTISVEDAVCILTYYAQQSAGLSPSWEDIVPSFKGSDLPLGTVSMPDTGDALTILGWTDIDLNVMIPIVEAAYPEMAGNIVYQNAGTSGYSASEQYTQYFASDGDVDLYFCDVNWISAYQNNDAYSAPLSDVGISEAMYNDAYSYTVTIGKDNNGILKGAAYQAAPGAYCYRADLAQQYLNVHSPEEMQQKISTWDDFWKTAAEVHQASNGVTAMADSTDGVWKASFFSSRIEPWVIENTITAQHARSCAGDWIAALKTNYDAGYIAPVNHWTNAWYCIGYSEGEYANGTFGYFFPSWSLAEGAQLEAAEGGIGGSTYGKYAICEGPSAWYWGGTWICVSPKCDNGTFAGQFLKAMTVDDDTMQQYCEARNDFVNNKTVMQEIIASGTGSSPLFANAQDPLPVLSASADAISIDGIVTQYDSTINSALQIATMHYCNDLYDSVEACLNALLDNLESKLPDVTVSGRLETN